jgi:small multidrug resistance pump
MTISGMLQLAASTLVFLLAAIGAKHWAISPTLPKLVVTLMLYTIGNLIMLRLVREFGMASAFTLSALLQLVAINVIAIFYFGERLPAAQLAGIMLAIIAVGLITFAPSK